MRKTRKKRKTTAKRVRKPKVRTIQTAVRLPIDVIGHLDRVQARKGLSRAKVITEIVRKHAERPASEPSAFD